MGLGLGMGLVLGPGLGLGLGLGLESACGPVEGREIVLPPGGPHVHLCHPALIDETLGPRDAVCGTRDEVYEDQHEHTLLAEPVVR
eukprot:scaffold60655_cov36-Phaeocystis_antarctica.AAC.1